MCIKKNLRATAKPASKNALPIYIPTKSNALLM